MSEIHLTAEGRHYAQSHADESIVARIALAADEGSASDWPQPHRDTAIRVCNLRGRTDVPGHPLTVLRDVTSRNVAASGAIYAEEG